jgi:uncharacterized membrane protein (DUF106 family)
MAKAAHERDKLKELKAALKGMAKWIKEIDAAYESGDPEAIRKVKERQAELGAESLRIGREWAEKKKRGKK